MTAPPAGSHSATRVTPACVRASGTRAPLPRIAAMAFVHLRTHTEFSVVDGTLRIDDAVAAAASDGQGALAITDLSNLFGAVKFYTAARRAGVKPIIGAELCMAADAGEKASSRLAVLVQNRVGY